MAPALDTFDRPLRNLRLSVTDRCNLRCGYCMPEESYAWLPKREVLTFEEATALVRALEPHGVEKVRLTGGEPLLRRDVTTLVAELAQLGTLRDLAMTTNAVLLEDLAAPLREAGLDRLTVSLDTLRPDRFTDLTRRDELARSLRGIDAATDAGFRGTKLNVVVMRGVNDDEVLDLLAFGRERDIEVRFIEYMDVGGATRWSMDEVVPAIELLRRIGEARGAVEPLDAARRSSAPADRFRLPDGQVFGVVASTTRPFCSTCDRARLTADGRFFTCLYAREGTPIAGVLRSDGAEAAARRIADVWNGRTDRGAEERLRTSDRGALAGPDELRDTPHLEMHTRGG
ncbi:MAG: GTP 3',8-cyclase MoaA [Planctomycetota bacterium]